MSVDEFRGDCGRCAALCCFTLAFDRGPMFAHEKAAGEACPKLRPDHRCAIHEALAANGYRGCEAYDCLGAGQKATAMFAHVEWRGTASGRRAVFEAFRRLRDLQTIRKALSRFGGHAPVPTSYGELLTIDLDALRARLERLADSASSASHRQQRIEL